MKTFQLSREGCGEGRPPHATADLPTEPHQLDLAPVPTLPGPLWGGPTGNGVGFDVPMSAEVNPDQPNHTVWPWMNPPGRRSGNASQRRMAVAAWIDDLMSQAARNNPGEDPTDVALAALAEMAGAEVDDLPASGLWTAGDRMGARDFVVAWWRYLSLRWEAFSEWPDPLTQIATLSLLATWRNPEACVRQSIAGSYKGIFPLRGDIDGDLYSGAAAISVAATRKHRTPQSDGATVRDTVRAYALRPDWQERLKSIERERCEGERHKPSPRPTGTATR